ncbi:MAG: H-NS histone, partial [Halomonadaceae bacterium]
NTDGRRKRPMKTYRNPHTGETVQTRGGNHKVLNAWRKQYGSDEVAGWQQD